MQIEKSTMLDSPSFFKIKLKDFLKKNFFQIFIRRYGIGNSLALSILKFSSIHPRLKMKSVLDSSFFTSFSSLYLIRRIYFFFVNYKGSLDWNLWNKKFSNVRFLRDSKTWRGRNHLNYLPVRGQGNRTNAVTRKKRGRI